MKQRCCLFLIFFIHIIATFGDAIVTTATYPTIPQIVSVAMRIRYLALLDPNVCQAKTLISRKTDSAATCTENLEAFLGLNQGCPAEVGRPAQRCWE